MTKPGASDEKRFCTFFLGEERYGIDILTVREINRQVQLTPARGAPPALRGFMNLRGQIVTVIDPAVRLGLPPRALLRTSRLVILKTNADLARLGLSGLETDDELAGLWIDRISDVVVVEANQISPASADPSSDSEPLISAIVQHNDQVIRLVDPKALLRHGVAG